jgi:hypothetical protein
VEDVCAGFWSDLHAPANSSQGIAHWGQEFRQTDSDIAARYGPNFSVWRRALGRVTGNDRTFSTAFSRAHGLEPDVPPAPPVVPQDDDDLIDSFLRELKSADG